MQLLFWRGRLLEKRLLWSKTYEEIQMKSGVDEEDTSTTTSAQDDI